MLAIPEDFDESTKMPILEDVVSSKLLPEVRAVDLEFQNLSYTVKNFGETKKILHNISGQFKSGEVTAILGPSGAGKSTLLNILSGYCSSTEGITGKILVSGHVTNPRKIKRLCTYIMQESLVQPHLSVIESMLIASKLKLANINDEVRLEEVERILEILGILDCVNTRCESISGGQKKRLLIALELVSNPSVLFLDEPTTGLDTYAGKLVMRALNNLANQGRTIICTIHQPCPLEFKSYDNVYVVARGSCVFSGPPSRVVPFLQEAGAPCPTTYSPADYIIEIVQMYPHMIDHLSAQVINEQSQSKANFTIISNESPKKTKYKAIGKPSSMTQLRVLLSRMLLQKWRNKQALIFQVLHHVLSGVLCGLTFFGVGNEASEFFQNIKLCLVFTVFYVYTYTMIAILYFPLEIEIVRRETFNNWYGTLTYYTALTVSTIPAMIPNVILFTTIAWLLSYQPLDIDRVCYIMILGCLSSFCSEGLGMFIGSLGSIKNGCILGPAILGPLFALSCYGIGYGQFIEPYMSLLMKISFMRYIMIGCWQALFGFNRPFLECNDAIYCHWRDPNLILRDLGIEQANELSAIGTLAFYAVLYRIIGYISIRFRLKSTLPGRDVSVIVIELAEKVIGNFRQKSNTNNSN